MPPSGRVTSATADWETIGKSISSAAEMINRNGRILIPIFLFRKNKKPYENDMTISDIVDSIFLRNLETNHNLNPRKTNCLSLLQGSWDLVFLQITFLARLAHWL